jgi:hypothetical protein
MRRPTIHHPPPVLTLKVCQSAQTSDQGQRPGGRHLSRDAPLTLQVLRYNHRACMVSESRKLGGVSRHYETNERTYETQEMLECPGESIALDRSRQYQGSGRGYEEFAEGSAKPQLSARESSSHLRPWISQLTRHVRGTILDPPGSSKLPCQHINLPEREREERKTYTSQVNMQIEWNGRFPPKAYPVTTCSWK